MSTNLLIDHIEKKNSEPVSLANTPYLCNMLEGISEIILLYDYYSIALRVHSTKLSLD